MIKCRKCNIEKTIDGYYNRTINGRFTHDKTCKECSIKEYALKEIEVDAICECCNIQRPVSMFRKVTRKDTCRIYYNKIKCKECMGYKKLPLVTTTGIKLSKNCLDFLQHLKHSRGIIDLVDSFKLAHFFTETFGYKEETFKSMEEELHYMWQNLLKIKQENENI